VYSAFDKILIKRSRISVEALPGIIIGQTHRNILKIEGTVTVKFASVWGLP